MNIEIITAVTGLIGGGLFRLLGEYQKAQTQAFERAMKLHEVQRIDAKTYSDLNDAAAKRGADWVRNLLVLLTVIAVVVIPFVVFCMKGQTVYPVEIPPKSFLGFTWGGGLKFEAINGYLLTPEMLRVYILAAFFFLGQGPLKRK